MGGFAANDALRNGRGLGGGIRRRAAAAKSTRAVDMKVDVNDMG